jgi:hypothetical protein
MKKLVSIIILCLGCFGFLEAQDNIWKPINGTGILGVGPDGSIFAYGEYGALLRSQDEGETWQIVLGQETGFTGFINSSCFAVSNEGRVFVFNDNQQTVVYSDDNGDTWQQTSVLSLCGMPTKAGICAPTNDVFVVWAENGEISYTLDGGETWDGWILDFLENAEAVSDLLVNENGDVYVSVAYYIMNIVGVYHSTLSDIQNWELVAFEGISVKDMAFDPEGNVVACGYNADGSSVGFQHIPGFYLFDGTSLAIGDGGIVYTPRFEGNQAALSYSADHGEHFTEIGEHVPLVDIAPGGENPHLFKGYDNYLYFDGGGEYWKSIPNADEIPTYSPLIGSRFFDEASALYYNITSNSTVEVTYGQWHFNTYVGDIVVPTTVTYEGVTYTVTAIGEIAFGGCEGQLNSVIVPNTVTTIGESAFASSPHLSSVILPNSIESFGPGAFARCYGLTSLHLPEGITAISERMFFDCTGLSTIEIPSSVTRIEKSAFEMSYITAIDIPESVTYIGESAFKSCTRLTSIDIPNSVTEMGPSVFYYCLELQSAHLPETLEVIPESLFERCPSLSAIDIPATVTEIGKSAFCYTGIVEMVVPDAVQIIGDEAFMGCSRLSSITLSRHLGSINVGLFQDCTALHSITIPQSVVDISRNAFKQSGLVSITFEGDIDDIGGYAFGGCTSMRSIVLPTTAHIEDAAFYGCSNLETVVITGRVYEIRSYAFGECTALQTVTLLQSIPPLDGGDVFAYCNDTVRLIVPCGAKEAYENSDWVNEPVVIEEDCGGGLIEFLGSEWYYEIVDEYGNITYQHLEYAADTTVNHKDVQIIIRTNTLYDKGEHQEVTREYLYTEDEVVYWWNKDLQEFTVLYDLGAEEGDEWEIKVGTQSLVMHVDAVNQYYYDGQLFRMLQVSDAEDFFSGTIVCGVGHLSSFFPERLMTSGKGYRVQGLRCYWNYGNLLFTLNRDNCDAIYAELHNGLDDPEEMLFALYPNPTHSVLFVETVCTPSLPSQTYRITNMMGQTLMTGQITAEIQQIDVSNLPQGIYFIGVGNVTLKFVVR